VDIGKLTSRAKALIDKRGGTDALKEDAAELKDIATGEGSLTDKAKRAVEAVKDPGAPGDDAPTREDPPVPADPTARERPPAP
jgi:hypothetical protein